MFLTSTGRAACQLFLRASNDGAGREAVAVQSFTCVAAVLPVLWQGLRPAWVDVDPATLSMSVAGLAAVPRERLGAVIVQHSFGLAAPVEALVAVGREAGAPVLEDCAHALGVRTGGGRLGTTADAALLSFGVEKTLRTAYGGALVVRDAHLRDRVDAEYDRLGEVPATATLQWLAYPLLKRLLRPLPAPAAARARTALIRGGLLAQELTPAELAAGPPPLPPARLPGVFCELVLDELDVLEANLAHRAAVGDAYGAVLAGAPSTWTPAPGASLLRYPVVLADEGVRNRVRTVLDRYGVSRSVWYSPSIFPERVDLVRLGYDPAACPTAESLARRVINLPTGRHVALRWARMLAADLRSVIVGAARAPEPSRPRVA
ncbi:MAG: DegT/DnrJ/EryC1/StrS family aminotransferase [Candidatus Dormibacteria bacterium]